MPLVSARNYFANKSIKLSDSFVVIIDNKETFRCAAFTVPKIAEWNEEEYQYGNVSQKFMIPKLDVVQELQLELYEGYQYENKQERSLTTKKLFFQQKNDGITVGNGYGSWQDFGPDGYTRFGADYFLNKVDFKELKIQILNNQLTKVVYEYVFRNLKLTKAEPYELSYQDESLTKWSLSFTFESMEKGVPGSE